MTGPDLADVTAAFRAGLLAESIVDRSTSPPQVTTVVPLVMEERPTLALPYASAPLVDAIAGSGEVTLALTDGRRSGSAWRPLVARVRAEVVADPEGERFENAGLLEQELLKHPPSRHLADSPLLRREHWWYLPRLIVTATELLTGSLAAPREGDHTALLAWNGPPWPNADVVEVETWEADGLRLRSGANRELGGLRGPGTLYVHRAADPNLERQTTFTVTGSLRGGWLDVEDTAGSREVPRFRLGSGWRATRRLERACLRELDART